MLRRVLMALALTGAWACSVTGQSAPDPRISIVNLVHTDRRIRFELRNNYSSPITFWQLRLEAACPDGSVAAAGGWGSDALWTIAAGADAELFAPVSIESILPGGLRQFEFPRPLDVFSQAGECDASKFKDLTVIFADDTGVGLPELIASQLAKRRLLAETLQQWMGQIHDLLSADDPAAALKVLRARLDDEHEDFQVKRLREDDTERLIMNRQIRQVIDPQFLQMRRMNETTEAARQRVERMVGFLDRLAELLPRQSVPNNNSSRARAQ
jgi:hypothetical protein